MIASNWLAEYTPKHDDVEASALSRVPQRAFGDNAWVRMTLASCAQHLAPAIRSGRLHRVANAVRAIAHPPSAQQIGDVTASVCDAVLSEAYASGDETLILKVANARSVIGSVVSELNEQVERDAVAPAMLRETVDAYVKLVALFDKHAAEQFDAVGRLAVRIGAAMHLPASTLLDIELAGRLNDIGTLAIAVAPYAAPAYEHHPTVGAKFLESVPSLAHLAPIVRSHHERFDGRGYPDGIAGEEIPIAARVINVAATFVELITRSPAHTAILPNTACHEVALGSGAQFDPEVVAATMHLLRYRQRTKRSA